MDFQLVIKIKERLQTIDFLSSHDYYHLLRVFNNVTKICHEEKTSESVTCIVQVAALLHDVGHKKISFDKRNDHEKESVDIAKHILSDYSISEMEMSKIIDCILNHRVSKGSHINSEEIKILQDADRLDALGALAIARTFSYDSNRPIYIPDDKPKDIYDGISSSSVNHIIEKILKLTPDTFITESAKKIAKIRLEYVEQFVEEFMDEWNGIK